MAESRSVNVLSTMIGEDYEDVLGERRGQSDLRWAAQEWQSSGGYRKGRRVPHEEAVKHVLHSVRVQQAIKKLSEAEGKPVGALRKDVIAILQTMGHSQDISAIRKFAFVLPKIMKTICDRLLVHRPGIERLRRLLQQQPVVLLPTHRSYADFLLVSYLAFHYKLPFPTIAAGMDFIHMAYIGTLFREAGAFYIKRSFMEDDLYWAVFQEYVHILVCQESAPLEFFLEGTRSRTGKSLRPKLGLLGCVCQSCWRQKTPDVYLVPLNISYSRTLEEELYAYEMLGVPKPKESTSGLFKAKSILNEQYGDIVVRVGAPVSAHDSELIQKYISSDSNEVLPLSPNEMSAVERIGLQLVREQQKLAVISTFSLAAHYFLEILGKDENAPIYYDTVLDYVERLLECTRDTQASESCRLLWEAQNSGVSVNDALRSSISLHKNIVSFKDDNTELEFHDFNSQPHSSSNRNVDSKVGSSVLSLTLQYYANQSIHAFVRPALVLLAFTSQVKHDRLSSEEDLSSVSVTDVRKRFDVLRALFSHDFIFTKGTEEEDFEEGMDLLCEYKAIDSILSSHSDAPLTTFKTCLLPFQHTYDRTLEIAGLQEWANESALVSRVQRTIHDDLCSLSLGRPKCHSALSLDSIRNAVRSVTKCGGLRNVRANGSGSPPKLVPCAAVLGKLRQALTGQKGSAQDLCAKL